MKKINKALPKTFKDIIKRMESEGWEFKRQSGSHCTYKKCGVSCTVPKHSGDIKVGTRNNIYRIVGWK